MFFHALCVFVHVMWDGRFRWDQWFSNFLNGDSVKKIARGRDSVAFFFSGKLRVAGYGPYFEKHWLRWLDGCYTTHPLLHPSVHPCTQRDSPYINPHTAFSTFLFTILHVSTMKVSWVVLHALILYKAINSLNWVTPRVCTGTKKICIQPSPSRASRNRQLKKRFFASLSKQRTGLQ